MARSYLIQWHAGIERFYWCAWENENFVGIRFVDPNTGLPTRATIAYRTIQDWMIGATLDECRVEASHVWTCHMQDSNRASAMIAWSPRTTLRFKLPDQATALRRLTGERESVVGGSEIDLSVMPIYIEQR